MESGDISKNEVNRSHPVKIVAFYSLADLQDYEGFQKHLNVWKRHSKITWLDIIAGQELQKTSEENIANADLLLFFVSSDALDQNDFYQSMEWALKEKKKHQTIIPILVSPCQLQGVYLNKLKFLPKDGKPISEYDSKKVAYQEISLSLISLIPGLSEEEKEQATGKQPQVDRIDYPSNRPPSRKPVQERKLFWEQRGIEILLVLLIVSIVGATGTYFYIHTRRNIPLMPTGVVLSSPIPSHRASPTRIIQPSAIPSSVIPQANTSSFLSIVQNQKPSPINFSQIEWDNRSFSEATCTPDDQNNVLTVVEKPNGGAFSCLYHSPPPLNMALQVSAIAKPENLMPNFIGVIFRDSTSGNTNKYYLYKIDVSSGKWFFNEGTGTGQKPLEGGLIGSILAPKNTLNILEVVILHQNIYLYANDKCVLEYKATSPLYAFGTIGMYVGTPTSQVTYSKLALWQLSPTLNIQDNVVNGENACLAEV